ncbi:unnamed protein product [Caenorhabditis brenneri]
MTSTEIKKAIEFIETGIKPNEDIRERWESVRRLGLILYETPPDLFPLIGNLSNFGAAFKNFSITSCDTGFSQQVLIPTSVLANCIRDVLSDMSHVALENFKRAYKMYNPAILAYTLFGYLGQDFTNPIKIAMRKNPSKQTFDEWTLIAMNVLTSLIHVEALAKGFFNEEDEYKLRLLSKKVRLLERCLDQWRKEYGV